MTWQELLFAAFLPQKTGAIPFVPEFDLVQDVSVFTGVHVLPNSRAYATEATARALMQKFGANRIEVRDDPTNLGGGHVVIAGDPADVNKPAKQRFLIFAPGTALKAGDGSVVAIARTQFEVNAGMLADCYARTPEADHPELIGTTGWPPRPWLILSSAEQNAWAMLRGAAGV